MNYWITTYFYVSVVLFPMEVGLAGLGYVAICPAFGGAVLGLALTLNSVLTCGAMHAFNEDKKKKEKENDDEDES